MAKTENIEREFAKADAEHTALSDRLQESANRRGALLAKLEEARMGQPEELPGPEQVEAIGE